MPHATEFGGSQQLRQFQSPGLYGLVPSQLGSGAPGEPSHQKRGARCGALDLQVRKLGGYFRGLKCLVKKSPPSLSSLAIGAFGMTGTAFEELGRRGLPAGRPAPLLDSFSFLILLFLFPIPGPR